MKQLGILDSAFINMEHPNTPQHIGSFGIYDQSTAPGGKVRFKSVIRHFEHQIKKIPLFRTRLIQAPGRYARPYWHVDDNFDVEFHVRHLALPQPGDWRQLCILIARLHSRPIDMTRPLWESYVIEGLDNIEGFPKGCFVIYTKIHHSIVDGGGADNFMAAIHDLEPILHEDDEEEQLYEGDKKPSNYELARVTASSYFNNAWGLTRGGFDLTREAVKSAVKLAKGELIAPPTDAPETRFNQPVSPYRIIESAKFKFDDFRDIKRKTGTKVNDVALAVVSGAMRRYLDEHNEHPHTSLVASVPMNMRTRIGDTGDANQVASIFVSLNSTINDPLKRLMAIHKSADEAKAFGENTPAKDALKLAGAMSPRVTKRLIDMYVDNKLTKFLPIKINTVVSNVPGPDFPLYCSGAKLIQYHGLGVLTPGVGIFHLVFTYCGDITITVLSDREMMPDPGFYRQCLDSSFNDLKKAIEKSSEADLAKLIDQNNAQFGKQLQPAIEAASTDSPATEAAATAKVKPARKRAARKTSSSSSSSSSSKTIEVKAKDVETAAKPSRKRAASSRKKSASSKTAAAKTSTTAATIIDVSPEDISPANTAE